MMTLNHINVLLTNDSRKNPDYRDDILWVLATHVGNLIMLYSDFPKTINVNAAGGSNAYIRQTMPSGIAKFIDDFLNPSIPQIISDMENPHIMQLHHIFPSTTDCLRYINYSIIPANQTGNHAWISYTITRTVCI